MERGNIVYNDPEPRVKHDRYGEDLKNSLETSIGTFATEKQIEGAENDVCQSRLVVVGIRVTKAFLKEGVDKSRSSRAGFTR